MAYQQKLKYGSVCSGIEAASVAWSPLGWSPSWFSEIEPFPSAVLASRWPGVENLGDMTAIAASITAGKVEAPDVLVGGTPCQAFSVAGLRNSLTDVRGQLTLSYVELANAIDAKRQSSGQQAAIFVWENVKGVLNTKDNAFGCFLAGMAGESSPLKPPGRKWSNSGAVSGPQRTLAWRVLDAQYYGLAQRRKRVFLVASARNDIDTGKILFEFYGLRRNSPPCRKKRQGFTTSARGSTEKSSHWDNPANPHPTLNQSNNAGGIGASNQELFAQRGAGIVKAFRKAAHGQFVDDSAASTCKASDSKGATDLIMAFSCKDHGADLTSDLSPTLRAGNTHSGRENGGHPPAIVYALQDVTARKKSQGGKGWNDHGPGYTLDAAAMQGVAMISAAFAEDSHGKIRWQNGDGQISGTLSVGGGKPGQGYPAVYVSLRGRSGGNTAELGGEVAGCLRTSGGGSDKPHVLAPAIAVQTDTTPKYSVETAFTLKLPSKSGGGQPASVMSPDMVVRRLMPLECERLQGFPDKYTLIPWRGKDAAACPDGPRYRAIGNSMAVPVMRWIGERIAAEIALNSGRNEQS